MIVTAQRLAQCMSICIENCCYYVLYNNNRARGLSIKQQAYIK